MTNRCAIIPQVWYNKETKDSKLFSDLWDHAKELSDDSIKARAIAKALYYYTFTDEYRNTHGDWLTAYKRDNGLLDGNASFLYSDFDFGIKDKTNHQGEPSFEYLKDNIINNIDASKIPFEDHNDNNAADWNKYLSEHDTENKHALDLTAPNPNFNAEKGSYRNPDEEHLSDEDRMFFHRQMSKILFANIDNYEKLQNGISVVDVSIKEMVINRLEAMKRTNKNENIQTIIDRISPENSNDWAMFAGYFNSKHDVRISKDSLQDTDTSARISPEATTRDWDESNQLGQNLVKTISGEVRFELAKAIYNTTDNAVKRAFKEEEYEYVDDKGFNRVGYKQIPIVIDMEGNEMHMDVDSPGYRYGIKPAEDLDVIWNQVISMNADNNSKEDILNTMDQLSFLGFNGALDRFNEKLANEQDDNFYNLFYRAAGLAITNNDSLNISRNVGTEDKSIVYSFKTNNRSSRPGRIGYDSIMENIRTKVTNNKVNPTTLLRMYDDYRKLDNTLMDRYNHMEKIAKYLGIPIDLPVFMYYTNFKNKLKGRPSMESFQEFSDNDSSHEANAYHAEITNFMTKIDDVAKAFLSPYGKTLFGLKLKGNSKYFQYTPGLRGAIDKIAHITAVRYVDRTDMSYLNAQGEIEYSPQYNSFATDFLRGIVTASGEVADDVAVKEHFKQYTQDPRLHYDNLLWSHEGYNDMGIFQYHYPKGLDGKVKEDEKGNPIREIKAVNREFLKNMIISQFSGIKDTSSFDGSLYRDINDDNWNTVLTIGALKGEYMIHSSDSPRIFKMKRDFIDYQAGLHFQSWETNRDGNTTGILDKYAVLTGGIKQFKESRLYTYLTNVFSQEFKDIALSFDNVFDTNQFMSNEGSKLVVRDNIKNNFELLHQGIETGIDDKTGKTVVIKNGKPAGRVFNKTNFSFIDEIGRLRTLRDYIEEPYKDPITGEKVPFNYIKEVLKFDRGEDSRIHAKIDEFLVDWMHHNQKATIEELSYCKEDLLNAKNPVRETRGKVKDAKDKAFAQKNALKYDLELDPTYEDDGLHKDINDYIVPRISLKDNDVDFKKESLDHRNASFNVMAFNLYMNHFINSVGVGNLLTGSVAEFKGMVDWNKRVNQIIRNGSSTTTDDKYTMLVMENVELKDLMMDLLDNPHNATKKQIESAKEAFKEAIDTSNGIDLITDKEYIARLKSFGVYNRYKTMIDAIEAKNDKGEYLPFDPNQYLYLMEQLKYFGYSRQLSGDRMTSYQNKNSTIVMFPRFIKGTEKELLYNFMNDHKIGDINTAEGFKLGDKMPYRFHKEDGSLDTEQLKISHSELEPYLVEQRHSDLRIQLETVPHLRDKDGTISTQLTKKIFTSIFNKTLNNEGTFDDVEYIVNNQKFKGRTDDYKDGKRGVYEDLQSTLAENVKQSAMELLHDMGALSNGKLNMDSNGNIKVDVAKINRLVENYFLDSNTDLNILKAIHVNSDGTTNVPYHHPTLLKLIESLLQSKITNKVTKQKLDNVHVPIQPNLFDGHILEKDGTAGTKHIQYSEDFLKSSNGNTRLKSDYYDKDGKYHPAQIVINPHDSRFYNKEYLMDDGSGRPDINKIKAKEPDALMMFGTRIPHEGAQSSFVAEIVGFMNTGSSQATTPDHLIARTGWDFDIDTVYMYKYALTNSISRFNINDRSEGAIQKRLEQYVKTYHRDVYDSEYLQYGRKIQSTYDEMKELDKNHNATIANFREKHISRRIKNLDENLANALSAAERVNNNEALPTDPDITVINGKIDKMHNERMIYNINTDAKIINTPELLDAAYKEGVKAGVFHDVEEVKQAQKNKSNAIRELLTKRDSLREQQSKGLEKFNDFRDEFDKLTTIQQALPAERNNNILDHFIAIHSHQANFENREKPNETQHLERASGFVNGLLDLSDENGNIHSIGDQMRIRNLNNNIAKLKEISVAMDNLLSIMNVMGGHNAGVKVPAIMKLSEFSDYKSKQDLAKIIAGIEDAFGKGTEKNPSYTYNKVDDTITIHNIGYMGNNYKNTGYDIQGEPISKQRSEVTANILDAVKKKMVDLNSETFGVFSYLASTPLSHFTNIHTGNESEVNRFIYPSLFVSQPIVRELSRSITANNKYGDKTYNNYEIRHVKENHLKELFESKTTTEEGNRLSISQEMFGFYDDLSKTYYPDDATLEKLFDKSINNISEEEISNHIELQQADYKALSEVLNTYNDKKYLNIKNINDFIEALAPYFEYKEMDKIENKPMLLEQLSENIGHDLYKKALNITIIKGISDVLVANGLSDISEYQGIIDSMIGDIVKGTDINKSITDKLYYQIGIVDPKEDINKVLLSEDLRPLTDKLEYIDNDHQISANVNQLSVIMHYETVSKASQSLSALNSVLGVDKKGSGPDNTTTNTLLNGIVKIETNFSSFENYMRENAKTSSEYKKELRDVNRNLNAAPDINSKFIVARDAMEKYEREVSTNPTWKSMYGEGILESVYGNALTNNPDISQPSRYPYFQSQLIYTHLLSNDLFGNVLATDNKNTRQLINNTLYDVNIGNDPRARLNTISYLVNSDVRDLNFFGKKTEQNPNGVDYEKLLGVTKPIRTWVEEYTVEGTKVVVPAHAEYSFEPPKFEQPEGFFDSKVFTPTQKFEKFKELSLANQLYIRDALGQSHPFVRQRIDINNSIESFKQFGYFRIGINNQDRDINQDRDLFRQMYNSKNPYDREIAENLIKYAFIHNGLQFGTNIGKFIPIDLFYSASETQGRSNDLYRTVEQQNHIGIGSNPSSENRLDENNIDALHKAMWNNPRVNPTMQAVTRVSKNGVTINHDYAVFKLNEGTSLEQLGTDNPLARHIIFEPKDKIDNSKYALSEYLTKNIQIGDVVMPILYKRFSEDRGTHYFYYPINRTLPFEYGETSVYNFKAIPINGELYDIAEPLEYIHALRSINTTGKDVVVKHDVVEPGIINREKLDKGYTDKVREYTKESSDVIHISTGNEFEDGVAQSLGSKVHIMSINEFADGRYSLGEQTPTMNTALMEAQINPDIPQNFKSGQIVKNNQGSNPIYARQDIIDKFGKHPTSMEMVQSGDRTRTTRSAAEMNKYNLKVGSFRYMIDKTGKRELVQVTDIYGKSDSRFKDNWHNEGLASDRFNLISTNLTHAVEFKVIRSEKDMIDTEKKSEPTLFDDVNHGKTVTILGSIDKEESTKRIMEKAITNLVKQNNIVKLNSIDRGEGSIGNFLKGIDLGNVNKTIAGTDDKWATDLTATPTLTMGINTPEEVFATVIAGIKNSELHILDIAKRLRDSISGKFEVSAMTELNSVVDKAKAIYESINNRSSIETMLDVLKVNSTLFSFAKGQYDTIMESVKHTAVNDLIDSNTFDQHKEYQSNLMLAFDYLTILRHIKDIPRFKTDELEGENKITVDVYNGIVDEFEGKEHELGAMFDVLNHKIRESQGIELIKKTRNAFYEESLYQQTLEYVKSKGYDPNDFPDLRVTQKELETVIHKMLNNNEDISWLASKLDSRRNTAIPLIDIMGKLYAEHRFRTHIDTSEKIVAFNRFLKEHGISDSKHYDGKRAAEFRAKFLDDDGNLITEYNKADFKKEVASYRKQEAIHLKALELAYTRKDVKEIVGRQAEIRKIKSLMSNLFHTMDIPSSSEEYRRHRDFYNANEPAARKKYEEDNNIKFKDREKVFRIQRFIPDDKFLNDRFARLEAKDKEFLFGYRDTLKTIVGGVFKSKYIGDNFMPFAYESTNLRKIEQFLGIANKSSKEAKLDLNGEAKYYTQVRHLDPPRINFKHMFPKQDVNETREDYEKRVVELVNKKGYTFTSIADIKAANDAHYKDISDKMKSMRNNDPVNVMRVFLDDMAQAKTTVGFEPAYRMALLTLGSDDFAAGQRNASGSGMLRNNDISRIAGKSMPINKYGKETEAYKSYQGFANPLYNESRVKNDWDVVLNALLRNTSLINMGFNIRSGVKNVIAGYVNILNEAWGGEYYNEHHLREASTEFRVSIPHLLRDMGHTETTNMTVAKIKYFGEIFEDRSEAHANVDPGMFVKGLRLWDNVAYVSMQTGEHFLQFATMLTMLKSHRLVNGQFMSEADFVSDRRMKVLESVLSPSQYKSLTDYVEKGNKNNYNATNYIDHIGHWLRKNQSTLDKSNKDAILQALKDEKTTAKEQFHAQTDGKDVYETLENQFELNKDTHRLQLKEGSKFTLEGVAMFADRIRAINHSLQGIYNTIDRNALSDCMMGEALMEFRKWMRPTWIRWFGLKYGKTTYSEGLGNYRSAAFVDFRRFLTNPLKDGLSRDRGDRNVILGAVTNVAKGYMDFLTNVSYNYNILPPHEQKNIRRSLVQIGGIALVSALLYGAARGLVNAKKKDNDDGFNLELEAWNNTVYTLYAVQNEMVDTTLAGWGSFYLRTKKNVAPIEQTIMNLSSFFYYGILYPFRTDKDNVYKTGVYKGQTKAVVAAKKVTPMLRQIQTQQYLGNTIQFYQMYNPIYNVFNVGKTSTKDNLDDMNNNGGTGINDIEPRTR